MTRTLVSTPDPHDYSGRLNLLADAAKVRGAINTAASTDPATWATGGPVELQMPDLWEGDQA